MKETFKSEASKLAWELFKRTGKIGYHMLYSNIENPPKELQIQSENEELER